jgi:lipopolysaccharide/colanic/teichoic acid biosynthesis glycosyltransferase
MIRLLDILLSIFGLTLLSPLFLFVSIWIVLDSKGSIFFKQKRMGKDMTEFELLKFRTMYVDSDKSGLLTVGKRDCRITKAGYYLRKFKMDELPQLINVLIGDMSIVGPRPEVRKYVELYNEEQRKVLTVKPGITDNASISYFDENDLLKNQQTPNKPTFTK